MRHRWFVSSAVAAGVLLCGGVESRAQVQSKCLVSKNKCVAKKAAALLKCEATAETPGKMPDPDAGGCVTKAQEKFDLCFEKLESKSPNDCVTLGDAAAAEGLTDSCIGAIVAAIDPPPLDQSKCGAGKKHCAAKKLTGLLKCYQKAQQPGKPSDPNARDCITKVIDKFDGSIKPGSACFAKLESAPGNDCQPPLGNTTAVETVVDRCVGDLIALLTTPSTSTTTSTTSTTTTTSTTEPTSTTTSTTEPTSTSTTSTVEPTSTTTSTEPTSTTTTTEPASTSTSTSTTTEPEPPPTTTTTLM